VTGPAVADRERTEQPGMGRLVGPTWRRVAGLGPERLVAVMLVVGAVGFTGTGLARLVHQRGIDVVTLPLALLAADLLIAAALVTGWYPIRAVAQGLAIFGALVHLLVLLRSGPWWIRGWSGMLTVAHLSALVLFFSLSAREYDEIDTADEDAEPADSTVEPPAAEEPATRAEAADPLGRVSQSYAVRAAVQVLCPAGHPHPGQPQGGRGLDSSAIGDEDNTARGTAAGLGDGRPAEGRRGGKSTAGGAGRAQRRLGAAQPAEWVGRRALALGYRCGLAPVP
jgi:hypothetical protein